jgi:hypothetical protein
MACENSGWRNDRIVGALVNLGDDISNRPREYPEAPWDRASTEAQPNHVTERLIRAQVLTWRRLMT